LKRGRPSKRFLIQSEIINILSSSSVPLTTAFITKLISEKLNQKINWNTVKKYINELVNNDKIQPIELPHSKKENKKGLTVYMLKK
jgi:predicted transcriptional regulator